MKHHDSGRPEPRAAAPAGFVAPEPQLPGRASTRQQPAALAPWREALETGRCRHALVSHVCWCLRGDTASLMLGKY